VVANIFEPEWEREQDRKGYRWRSARVGPKIGAHRVGASIYDLVPGERTFPYHFHHGNEEWLLVLDGAPTIRTPAGERTLRRGDVVCFPSGPDGAHVVTGPGRVLIVSTMVSPSIAVYPDSDKVGTRVWDGDQPDRLNFRRRDAVDYWDGE
jgi:uncharacterized cupin superfamily protein